LDAAFATLLQLQADELVIDNDSLFSARLEKLAALTSRHAVPTVFQFREFATAGSLMSYGADFDVAGQPRSGPTMRNVLTAAARRCSHYPAWQANPERAL
jgi:hypothetical protein